VSRRSTKVARTKTHRGTRTLRMEKVREVIGKNVYHVVITKAELAAVEQAELDMTLPEKLYSKLEDFSNVADACYIDHDDVAVVVKIDRTLDNGLLHGTVLTMISTHVKNCLSKLRDAKREAAEIEIAVAERAAAEKE